MKDIEKSFKATLRTIAKEQKRDPGDLWQMLMIERFLARLAKNKIRDHFILKGAVLLSKYINLGRETRDLDFLAKGITNNVNHLRESFEKITETNLNDGFSFTDIKVTELRHPHMNYPGAAISMICHFGKTRSKVSIDIGFGDIVEPLEQSILLLHSSKGPLFENKLMLKCYPKEFIFAEKLEAIVKRGPLNSRMKDFYDLLLLIKNANKSSFEKLDEIIREVFKHRNTPFNIPIKYSDSEITQLQFLWGRYLRIFESKIVSELPKNIDEVVAIINEWISELLFMTV